MPKIKDLGITVVPEQFKPPEIGGGGGCGASWGCGYSYCTDCTNVPYSICGTTPGPVQQQARAGGCTDCTTQAFSICGTTRGGGGCSDCTTQAYSICGTTPGAGGCSDCTTQAYSICGTTPGAGGCTDCTTQAYSICGTTPGGGYCTDCTTQAFSFCGTTRVCTDCTTRPFSICGTTRITGTVACRLGSRFPTILDVTTPCGGSFVGPETIRPGGGLRVEDVQQLRTVLQEQMKALDEYEKSLGPQTMEEVEAREKQLNEEMAKLKSIRADLSKKK